MILLPSANPPLSQPKNEGKSPENLQLTANENGFPTPTSPYLQAAISNNTRRAYRSDVAHFIKWGGIIPAGPEVVTAYITHYAGTVKAATLARRLVSIGRAHTSQGLANPCGHDLVRATLRGIRRIHGVASRQVAPAVREDMLQMVEGLHGVKGVRDRALLLLGFAGAFRRSELVSLTVADLEFVDRGLIVHLRRSKTDQEGVGRKIAIPFARGSVCPVQAIRDWLITSGISDGPVFRPLTRHGRIDLSPLSGHAVAEIVKARAHAAGLNPVIYSGHSLRAGLITSAAQAGVSVWKIKAQSGHRTDAMVSRYVRDADLFTNNAAGAVL
jgi:integrase